MNEQEQRDLARRLADGSDVLDFEKALEIVRHNPTGAEDLLREWEQGERRLEELARANRRLHRAAREFR
jgi:hypothetical protein